MTPPLLEARGLWKRFGTQPVLEDVGARLTPGRLLVVLGPNGAGKTTLLRILAGVLPGDRGTVELGGQPLGRHTRRELARELAVVPQEFFCPFPFRVSEMVGMGRTPYLGPLGRERPHDREITEAALGRLGLGPFAERLYPTLSGGEKQRVLLARAIAQATDLLLLDEPTAHMDLGHRLHTFEWLRTWLAEGSGARAALLVTHDLMLGARFADDVLLLDQGRIAGAGPPAEVLSEERIAAVYGVEAHVTRGSDGRVIIVANRSLPSD